jgi:hypothetical protein
VKETFRGHPLSKLWRDRLQGVHPNPVRVVQRIQRKGGSAVIHIFLAQVAAVIVATAQHKS